MGRNAHLAYHTRHRGRQASPGAVVATNGNGETKYNLCPPKGTSAGYVAVVFALRHELPAKAGFDPRLLRLEALRHASYQSMVIFNYKRR